MMLTAFSDPVQKRQPRAGGHSWGLRDQAAPDRSRGLLPHQAGHRHQARLEDHGRRRQARGGGGPQDGRQHDQGHGVSGQVSSKVYPDHEETNRVKDDDWIDDCGFTVAVDVVPYKLQILNFNFALIKLHVHTGSQSLSFLILSALSFFGRLSECKQMQKSLLE